MKRLLFLILFCLSGCGRDQKVQAPPPPPLVTVMKVEAKDVPISVELIAQTQSSHLVNIQARVSGFLNQQVYKEGEIVQKDQVLFIMDKKPFEAQLNAAKAALAMQEAALETARLNLARVKPLAENNALSQKDLDDATGTFQTASAAVEQAKAQVETALLNLSYCTITSPLKGITSAALKQEGSYLSVENSQLTTVSAISPMWVNFSLSENQVQEYQDQVKSGKVIAPKNEEYEVVITRVNGQVYPHKGKITFTEPFFNPQTGTFLIRASVENPDHVLVPNQYVRAKLEGSIRPNAILIPQKAVRQSTKGHYVWVIDEKNEADFRPVKVGEWQGENWFISEGLKSGDRVVVEGGQTLKDGDPVRIKETPA